MKDALQKRGEGLPNPAIGAVFELDVEPGATAFEHGKFGAAVQGMRKLQGIAVAVAFAHGRFFGHDHAVLGRGVSSVEHPGGSGEEERGEGGATSEPEPSAAAPKSMCEGTGPSDPEEGNGDGDLRLQGQVVLPKEEARHECLLGAGVDLVQSLAAGITQIGL